MTTPNKVIKRTLLLSFHSMKTNRTIFAACACILTTHNKQNMPQLLTHSTDGATIKSTQNQL